MEKGFTMFCFVLWAILLFSGIHLHQCRELYGYKFPVFSTLKCPRNQIEWNVRSSALNCTENNGYTCLPNKNFTELLEFCYTQPLILIEEGLCLFLVKEVSLVDGYNCSRFRYGCPKSSYFSTKIYEYPSCITIKNGCFVAEPSCTSTTTSPSTTRTETHLNPTYIDYSYVSSIIILLLLGLVMLLCILCVLFIYLRKKEFSICNRNDHQDEERGQLLDEKESFYEEAAYKQWTKDDKNFVQTRAYDEVKKRIEGQNLVVVSGDSGSGKSAIIQHIALKYKKKGWSVKPLSDVQELVYTYLKGKRLKKNTLLVLNDPFGKESLDRIVYNLWLNNEGALKVCLETLKLLMSCRTSVIEDCKENRFFKDKSSIVDINNDQYKLTLSEKLEVLKIYQSGVNLSEDEVGKIVQTEIYFPLLCKLYFCKNENHQNGTRFFEQPQMVVEEEIRNYKKTNKETYCALVLLVLFNNKLCVGDLSYDRLSNEKLQIALKLCKMNDKDASLKKIYRSLSSLEGFFVRKIGNIYQFYHDFLMEVTAFVFGTDYPAEMIKYADISFLRRRVRLKDVDKHNDRFVIYLNDNQKDVLVERLFTDMFGVDLLEVVLNPCLRNKNVCKVFKSKVENSPEKLQQLLERNSIRTDIEENNRILTNSCLTNVTFVSLEEKISPIFALITFHHTEISLHCLKTFQYEQLNYQSSSLFSSVCSNGSMELYNMFSGYNIENYLKEKWGSFYPIHIVSVFHNHNILQKLLQANADVDVNLETDDENGWTPLTLAAGCDTDDTEGIIKETNETRQSRTLKCLLDCGAKINNCAKNGSSPIYIACMNGNERIVQILLTNKADINLCEKNGASPLYIACQYGYDCIVKLLLKRPTDINRCTKTGINPLCIACKEGHESTVKLLLKNRADINICKKEGAFRKSPLYTASQFGHENIVQLLLDEGADINLRDEDEKSPLFTACTNGYDNIVKLLLDKEADINLRDQDGKNPLFTACTNGHDSIVQLLLNKGPGINLCDNDGKSPLFTACTNGHDNIVQLLLYKEADINLCDNDGQSPLHTACTNGHDSIVQLLLNKGADINLCDEDGKSPLYIACQNGHDRIVNNLINEQANTNVRKGSKETPQFDVCYNKLGSIEQPLVNIHNKLTKADLINLCEKDGKSPLFIACKNGHKKIVDILLSNEAEVNLCTKVGQSPLYAASACGYDDIVELLVKNGADINQCTKDGVGPLHVACEEEMESTVQLLLENGSDANLCKKNGDSPLCIASQKGFYSIVKLLLNKANIDLCRKSPLFTASQSGHENIVQILLDNGADVNLCQTYNESPLYAACEYGRDAIVQLLLDKGANINLCDEEGESPLHTACRNGYDSIVKLLLDKGADINLCDEDGLSPLHTACRFGYDSIVQLLLNKGADINLCDKDGESPLYTACTKGCDSIVQLLLDKGVDINLCDEDGVSPLHTACRIGYDSIVQLLLNKGADINVCDEDGESPLHKACTNGCDSIVQLLLDKGADINLRDENGETPLRSACTKGHYSIVQLLLNKGADINLCDEDGKSPLYAAGACGYDDIVELLVKKGADINQCTKDGVGPLHVAFEEQMESTLHHLL